jgi:hypothetical protein
MSRFELRLAEFWWNSGGILAEVWRKSGGMLDTFWWNSGGILAEFWRNAGGMLAECWWNFWRQSGGIWWHLNIGRTEVIVYVHVIFRIFLNIDYRTFLRLQPDP